MIYETDISYWRNEMKKVYNTKSYSASALFLLGAAWLLFSGTGTALATETAGDDAVANRLQGDWGQIKLNLRYRFEHVEQDGLQTANGDPIRLRLGYLTPNLGGFQGFVEFEGNTPVFKDDYNSKANGKTDYAVIADPAEGELNQGWLSFDSIPDSLVKVGRQEISYDNQRFVGGVAWRQMEQTFDSITLLNKSIGNFSAKAAYLWNVRTIISKDVNMKSPLLNMKYTFPGLGSLGGYGYWLDYDDPKNSGSSPYTLSTQTVGLRFNGSAMAADNLKLLYTAEYANQSDYQENPNDFTAEYYHFIGGFSAPNKDSLLTNIGAKIAYEVQTEDNGVSFQTPLGTNHAFGGMADLFLTTPDAGLRDLYGIASASVAGVKIDFVYHDFQADAGGINYGTEFDAKLSKKFSKHYSLFAAYANYSADEYKADTQKFWLQLTMSY
jgi:hypothetical protein